MSKAAFRQADLERILRAAKKVGAVVQVDLRTLEVKILPALGDVNDIRVALETEMNQSIKSNDTSSADQTG